MTFGQVLQNFIFMGLPIAIWAAVVRWRSGTKLPELATRLGLRVGDARSYGFALAAAVAAAFIGAWMSSLTSQFPGSMLAPFLGATPTLKFVASAFIYGFLGTGFPEELLFRGLIGGVLFRRLGFWKANFLQAFIFLLPHLLILIVAPNLWLLAITAPLGLGLLAGWLRHRSGSIGPSTIVHAAGNVAGALVVLNWAG
jgi:membrane protease YdiL (CAAX protease family)